MVIAQQPAQSLAASNGLLLVADVRVTRKQQDVALSLVIALSMIMVDVFAQRPPQGPLAEEDHLAQALSFTDLTQRSAKAFKFGLRAGSVSGSIRPDAMMVRNDWVYFVSRSCRR